MIKELNTVLLRLHVMMLGNIGYRFVETRLESITKKHSGTVSGTRSDLLLLTLKPQFAFIYLSTW
jgi:hypothetical protein